MNEVGIYQEKSFEFLCSYTLFGYYSGMRGFFFEEVRQGCVLGSLWIIKQSGFPAGTLDDSMITMAIIGGIGVIIGLLLGVFIYDSLIGKKAQKKIRQAAQRDIEKNQHAERERLHRIYDLISTITSSLIYSRVLDMALDLSTTAISAADVPTERLASAALLFSKSESGQMKLSISSSRRFSQADTRLALPAQEGVLAQVIESGVPQLCTNVSQDAEISRFISLNSYQSAYCIPLRSGLDTYGVMLFAHPETNFFGVAQRDILDIMVHQAVIALQNARLYNDLAEEKERMLAIQEEARKKLARDLHDGPTQSVAAIAMRVNFTRRMMERDVQAAADELVKIEDLARRTTKEIRHMLFTLRPLVLESQGLVAALQAMADKMRETYDQNVIISVDSKVLADMEIGKQTVVFYIAEEAVNNARKYAQAAHIWVRIKDIASDLALLEIQDDGVGFNVGSVNASYEQRGSLGMVNMRERAELVNGVLKITSTEGRGTIIRVAVPVTEEAADRLRQGLQ